MSATIGIRRTFLPSRTRQLPDPLSAFAGPFWNEQSRRVAWLRQEAVAARCLTKRLSKLSLLEQTGAGCRPPALTRIVDAPHGRTKPSVSDGQLKKNREVGDRPRRPAVGKQGPPRDRRTIAGGGDRKGSGRRSETDLLFGLGQPKSPPLLRGRASPATAATGGLPTGWHSSLVTCAPRNPACRGPELSSGRDAPPAPHRPHGLSGRGAPRHHGEEPWTSEFDSAGAAPCVRAGGATGRAAST